MLTRYLGSNAPVAAAEAESEGETMYVVNCQEYVTLRSGPSTSTDAMAHIPLGTAVMTYGSDGDFIRVEYEGLRGYVLNEYLDYSPMSFSAYLGLSLIHISTRISGAFSKPAVAGRTKAAHMPCGVFVSQTASSTPRVTSRASGKRAASGVSSSVSSVRGARPEASASLSIVSPSTKNSPVSRRAFAPLSARRLAMSGFFTLVIFSILAPSLSLIHICVNG